MDFNSRRITAIIENALLEDRATRDATSYACIDPSQRAAGTILAKQDCVLAGLGAVGRILDVYGALDGAGVSHYEVTSHPEIFDSVRLHRGQAIAVIRDNARVILSCERVILNLLQRLSGVATLTRKFVEAISGTKARILDTRKTAPGLRMLDKYAVRCGGRQPAHCPRLEQTFDNLGHSHLNRFRLLCDSHEARLPRCIANSPHYSCATPAIYRMRRRFLGKRWRQSSTPTTSHYQREHHG